MGFFPRMGINFIYKCILFPSVIYIAEFLLPYHLHFSSWVAIAVLSAIFIMIGIVADETVLPAVGRPVATMQGTLFMIGFTWFFPYLYPGNEVKMGGAVAIGVILGCMEYMMHGWIQKQQNGLKG